MAYMTLVKSTKPDMLGKRYELGDDGKLTKSSIAQIWEGQTKAHDFETPEELAEALKDVCETSNIALMSGRFVGAEPDEKVNLLTEAGLAEQLGCMKKDLPGGVLIIGEKRYAARLKRGIEPSAWVLIDADNPPGIPCDWAAMAIQERLELLEPLVPGISTCTRVEYRSSSARVVKDGEKPGGATHAWIEISDATKLEILREYVKVQMQLQGLSFLSSRHDSQTGVVKALGARTVIDLAVWVPGRLVFCSRPEVKIDGYYVADAGVKIVNPGGRTLDVSRIVLPSEEKLDELRVKTGHSLSYTKSGTSITVTDDSSLRWDTSIEIKGVTRPLREVVAGRTSESPKIRCETQFRASQSEAAFIKILDSGFPMLHDVGTSTTYFLGITEQLSLNVDVSTIDLNKIAASFAAMEASGQLVTQPVKSAPGHEVQQKVPFKDLLLDPARITRDRKRPISNVANVATVLIESAEWDSVFAYDEMADEIMVLKPLLGARTPHNSFKPHRLRDQDVIHIQRWMQQNGFRNAAKQPVIDAITLAAHENIISPVRHYLEGLEQTIKWSPTTHPSLLDRLCADYFGAQEDCHRPGCDPKYLAEVGRRFMIAAVARALKPGCKVDTMLVLEGPQGKGKSSAAQVLFEAAYFSDNMPNIGSKDASDHIRGKWCIEFPELSAMSKADVESIKAFITRQTDRFRRPYDRHETVYDRRCVFIGTTNQDTYLRDETGNRRFWPVRAGTIDLDAIRRDRDVLWAEAVYRFRQGEAWHMPKDLLELVSAAQESRVSRDIWQEMLAPKLEGMSDVSLSEVARLLLLDRANIARSDQNRLTACLKALGFEPNGRFTTGQYRDSTRYTRAQVSSK